MKSSLILPTIAAVCSVFLTSCTYNKEASVLKNSPLKSGLSQSPQATIDSIELPEGYHLELVLAEPQIAEPVVTVFDGNGRMYVAEMITYMLDADATGEFEPVSRVSRHEDTNGDGEFDRHTTFVDNLLLPRVILPLDDRIIIGETNTLDLYAYRDTDGDGVADEKTLWFEGGKRGGNLEHQPSGLIWAQDNWIYTTYNGYRLRHTQEGTALKEEIPANSGQWGLTQDDYGKIWIVNAGNEQGPIHFQQHLPYGKFSIDGEEAEGFRVVWPIDNIPDTQGGRFQLRDDNSLNHFTATCGQDIFRGDRLPADLRGDLLFAEPVGRLIRRAKVSVEDGITRLENAYDQNEFMRTKDPLFRPVNMTTAPDGTLYIVDMYRGIIQEGSWTKKGSYLRETIDDYDLAKEYGRGRIYRLVHDDFERGPQPNMLNESPKEWVKHLSHPNGWWRDTAQKLIVVKGDKSVVPELENIFKTSDNTLARAHALWTLEGLGELGESLIQSALNDSNLEIRRAGIRLAEPFLSDETNTVSATAIALLSDPEPQVVIQTMLSQKRADAANAKVLAKQTAEESESIGVYAINEQLWADSDEDPYLAATLGTEGLRSYRSGKVFYESLCFACHGADGLGTPIVEGKKLAPPLSQSRRVVGTKEAIINIVLHGLQGPVDDVDYGAPMITMASYSDENLADVLTYVRNSFGNRSPAVTTQDIATARSDRSELWTIKELESTIPVLAVPLKPFRNRNLWNLSASHADDKTTLAVDEEIDSGYITKSTPYVGMWFQIELPTTSVVRKIELDARGIKNGYPLAYEVRISDDGENWGNPVAAGRGEPLTQIHMDKVTQTRFIQITMTEKNSWTPWAINNLEIYGEENPTLAANSKDL